MICPCCGCSLSADVSLRVVQPAHDDRAILSGIGDGADIDCLPITGRMISALRDRGYLTVGDLRTATDADLLRARGVGRGRLAQIRRYLSMTGGVG